MMESIYELAVRFKKTIERMKSDDQEGYRRAVEHREKADEAMRLFSESVVKNRDRVMDRDGFRRLLRAYLNIMTYGKKKTKIKEALRDLDWLKDTRNIPELCTPGRYWSITRTRSQMHGSLYRHKRKLLDLIEDFSNINKYDALCKRVGEFADLVPDVSTASLTGILAALRPTQFMVYNRRSVVPLWNTEYGHLANRSMKTYLDFNAAYVNSADLTGLPLLTLDVAANEMYCRTD